MVERSSLYPESWMEFLILETRGIYEYNSLILLKRKLRSLKMRLLIRSYVMYVWTWEGWAHKLKTLTRQTPQYAFTTLEINDLINKTQNQFIFLSLTAIQTQTSKTRIPAAELKPQAISQLPKTLPFTYSASLSPTSLLLGLHLMQKQSSQLSWCLELEILISHMLLVLLSI